MIGPSDHTKPGVKIDQLIDENGSPIEVSDNSTAVNTPSSERSVGATGPANWSRLGLIGLAIVAAILLFWQLLYGGAGTDVVSGTPTISPDPSQEVETQPAPDASPAP